MFSITGSYLKLLCGEISACLKGRTFVISGDGQPPTQSKCFHGSSLGSHLSPFCNESFSKKGLPYS